MEVMEANLQGWWRPSPGSIYPLLKRMVEEGILTESDEKRYGLTVKGRDEVEHPWPWFEGQAPAPRTVEGAIEELTSYVSYLEDLARSNDRRITDNAEIIGQLGRRLTKLGEGK